jgi:hypothetical protein
MIGFTIRLQTEQCILNLFVAVVGEGVLAPLPEPAQADDARVAVAIGAERLDSSGYLQSFDGPLRLKVARGVLDRELIAVVAVDD